MSTSTVNVRHLVLGLLTQRPMSGYDIRKFLKSLSWLIGSPSSGSLYPALRGLLQNGLVTVDVIRSQDKPSRKVYSITEAGRQTLQEWVERPVAPGTALKAFVMRLILASNFSRAGLIAHLKQRRSQVAAHRAVLEQMIRALDEKADLGQRLALNYGLAIAGAELGCLDGALDQLLEEPLSEEVMEGARVTNAT